MAEDKKKAASDQKAMKAMSKTDKVARLEQLLSKSIAYSEFLASKIKKEGEKGDRKYVHIAPDGTKVDYTAEDNALIAEADRKGSGVVDEEDFVKIITSHAKHYDGEK